ncbi:PREDICTED: PRUPE_6G129900 [Prunus dulcis]|uniref:PREDICTED: PRUPE_6G129900 n=1 Tax=Prunus dulcis TaxID=3755 RepID=A0A5E4FPT3_PRUDU|nr:PREDICTED: PRUPE_6G129900 [Prunus dulcis]
MKMKIVELVGSNVKPTLVRDLTFCEHDFGNRLVLVLLESLSGVLINLKKRQSLTVRMIGPSLNVFDMTLSRSADGGHVLKDWNSVMQTENFEKGDTVYPGVEEHSANPLSQQFSCIQLRCANSTSNLQRWWTLHCLRIMKMKIVELVGSNVKPTLVRDLTFCEHDFGNRLVLVLLESLSGVLINLKKRQSLTVRMIGPSLNVFDMTLSRSADGGHVLKDWNSVMQTENFEKGDTVYPGVEVL